jgi:hypothetical protein
LYTTIAVPKVVVDELSEAQTVYLGRHVACCRSHTAHSRSSRATKMNNAM